MNTLQLSYNKPCPVMNFMVSQATDQGDVPTRGEPGRTHLSPMHFNKVETLTPTVNGLLQAVFNAL